MNSLLYISQLRYSFAQMYLHLILNHLSPILLLIGICMFIISYFLKNKTLSITACLIILFAACIYFPAFYTGEAAEHHVEEYVQQPDTHERIESHEEKAEIIYFPAILLAALSLINVVFIRRNIKNVQYLSMLTMIVSIVVFILLLNVAHTGAMIRRPEL